jgi:hypothetical protein
MACRNHAKPYMRTTTYHFRFLTTTSNLSLLQFRQWILEMKGALRGEVTHHTVAITVVQTADIPSRCALAVAIEPCSEGSHISTRQQPEARLAEVLEHGRRQLRAQCLRCAALPRQPWPATTTVRHPVDQARGRRRPAGAAGSFHAARSSRQCAPCAAPEGVVSFAQLSRCARCFHVVPAGPHGLGRPERR